MHKTIDVNGFRQAFEDMGRREQFSYEALGVLFEHYEECFPDSELDVIAICCDWTEYESIEELQHAYSNILLEFDDPDEFMNELEGWTQALKVDNSYLVLNF